MRRNPKVLSPNPVAFAPYSGFTYLFNTTAVDRGSAHAGREFLNVDPVDPRHILYDALRRFVAGVFSAETTRQYTFCALNPSTYHVTACDGMTVSAMERMGDKRRLDIARQLTPGCGGAGDSELMKQLAPPFKIQPSESGVRFRFGELSVINRDGTALVAMLQPADAGTSQFLELLGAERRRISTSFGLPPSSGPEAHVSLGYFFDDDLAGSFENEIPRLDVEGLRAEAVMSFQSISLYWFNDMQTFWRAA